MQDHILPPSASQLDIRGKASFPFKKRKKKSLFRSIYLSTKYWFILKTIYAVAHFCQAFHVTCHWLNWSIPSNVWVYKINLPYLGSGYWKWTSADLQRYSVLKRCLLPRINIFFIKVLFLPMPAPGILQGLLQSLWGIKKPESSKKRWSFVR